MNPRLALAAVALALAGAAHAPTPAPDLQIDPKAPVYVTAHVDVTGDHIDQAIVALKAYVAASKIQPGAVRVEAVEEPRPNHFDLIEVWKDRAAYEAHLKSASTIGFHDAIHPLRGSPFEERLGVLIAR